MPWFMVELIETFHHRHLMQTRQRFVLVMVAQPHMATSKVDEWLEKTGLSRFIRSERVWRQNIENSEVCKISHDVYACKNDDDWF